MEVEFHPLFRPEWKKGAKPRNKTDLFLGCDK